jgi:hypothetical protein
MTPFTVDPNQPNAQPTPQGASAPPRRHRGMLVGLLVLVFLSGGVVGGALGMMLTQQRFSECLRHPERVPERMISMLKTNLHLNDEQSVRVTEIVNQHHTALEAIRAEVHPRFAAEFDAMDQEIKQVLTADQQSEWNELRRRFRRNLTGPRREREKSNAAATK